MAGIWGRFWMVRTDLLYYKYFAKHVRVRFKYVSDRV